MVFKHEPWTPTSRTIYATNPKQSKKSDPIAVFSELPVFAIPTHEKEYKVDKKRIGTTCKWYSNVKTMNLYFKNNLCN